MQFYLFFGGSNGKKDKKEEMVEIPTPCDHLHRLHDTIPIQSVEIRNQD